MSSRQTARLLPLIAHAVSKGRGLASVDACRGVLQGLGTTAQRLHTTFLLHRSLASNALNDFDMQIKRLLPILEVREALRDKSVQHDYISYGELESLLIERGAARDAKEAAEVSKALDRAGITVLLDSQVHLRPETFINRKPVPDHLTVGYLEAKLSQINAKLQPLEDDHQKRESDQRQLELHASRQATAKVQAWLHGGLFILLSQTAIMYYLTFVELSWDVMEPIAYMISLSYAIIGYIYFLWTKGHVFDLEPFHDYWTNYYKGQLAVEKALKGGAPDQEPHAAELKEEEYHRLMQARKRCMRLLEAARVLERHNSSSSAL